MPDRKVPGKNRITPQSLMAAVLFCWLQTACAVDLDVPYVETPADIVELMLDMADVKPDDHVIDLGTGDGRIVIAAVKRGATGLGVDLDPQRIQEAEQNASKTGVSDRVKFAVEDLFKTDISPATVLTLFLNSEVNMRLRPALFDQLKPGTRVVSHNFDMEDWQPDQQEQLMVNSNNNFYIHDIFYWVVPAKASGQWQWNNGSEAFQMKITQQFQEITAEISINQMPLLVKNAGLTGDEINISASTADGSKGYSFSGRINNDNIAGTIQISGSSQNWSAVRKP